MERLSVKKTYKLFIGGKFPRTESGRYIPLKSPKGELLANVCQASRKDFRNAVVAARKAQPGWAQATPYLRGQILYRMAEMVESRSDAFVTELQLQGLRKNIATTEVSKSIDCLVHYAGWSDKYSALFSSVNPVASPHYNFSTLEPTGVVTLLPPENSALLGLVATIAPVIVGGNTCIVISPETLPLSSISLAEALATSDLPGGVINILTGLRGELASVIASHMDVDAVVGYGCDLDVRKTIETGAAETIKRVAFHPEVSLPGDPYRILECQEIKTTWHPVGA